MITLVICVLLAIIIAQQYEKYKYSQMMLKQLDDAIKASMSRSLNDYMSATSHDPKKETKFVEPDEISIEEATEEQFNKAIGIT